MAIRRDWPLWARADQLPPDGDWTTWVFLGGRGAGKTRAGAEWVRGLVEGPNPPERIALVGETFADVRETMIEGVSGLRAISPNARRPRYVASRRQLAWPNGVIAQVFSSEDPEALRGPQFAAAWCDELAKWKHAEETFDMLQFGLRLGDRPRQMATTTPRATPLLRRVLALPGTVTTHAATHANAANLSPVFLASITQRYAGTALGRQELDGELITDRADGLWSRAELDAARVRAAPELARVVVAVDPAVSGRRGSDACGIVVAGLGHDGRAYVIEDATHPATTPASWARRAAERFHAHGADALIVEVNQGGDLVASVIAQVDRSVPVTAVHATRGKWLRAEPIAARYAQGRVAHVGAFPALEDEMCDFGRDGLSNGRSPDRLDALVWALTALFGEAAEPRIRRV